MTLESFGIPYIDSTWELMSIKLCWIDLPSENNFKYSLSIPALLCIVQSVNLLDFVYSKAYDLADGSSYYDTKGANCCL